MRALVEGIAFHLNRFLKYNPAAMATAASAAPRIGISVVPASEFPLASDDGLSVGLVDSPGDAGVGGVGEPPVDGGDGTVSAMGAAVGNGMGKAVGTGVGIVGNEDGALVGLRVEVGRCEYEGAEVGLRVGTVVGARVGTADGGRVYATTIVEDDTEELAVTFSLAVMFTPVMFELALMSSLVRLPLVAAEARADANSSVRLAALPA